MNRQRPLILILLVVYIFLPTAFNWVTDPTGAWYKPFVIWFLVIIGAFLLQKRKAPNDL